MTKRTIPSTDEAWDERALGADEAHVAVAPDDLSKEADDASGTQLISIRMQKSMIDDFKAIASRNKGIGYQTLMKQILQRYIDSEKRLLWNDFVAKKLKEGIHEIEQQEQPKAKARKAA